MLDRKYKILFINSNKLTFVVFKIIENKVVVFYNFSQQIIFSNFSHQIMELFSKASTFLNESIDKIDIIFDEPNISKINFANIEINNCRDIAQTKKIITTTLNKENCYVNEINIKNFTNNGSNINCNYTAFVTKYEKYKYYIEAIKQCHVKIAYASNIYNLLFGQNNGQESFVKIIDKQIVVGRYENAKLIDIKITTFDIDYVHTKIAKFFNLSNAKIHAMLTLLDKTILNINDNIKIAVNLTPTKSTLNFIYASVLLNEFNFYFIKELNRSFKSMNLTLCSQKYFVGANQYNNLIMFITTHNFSSYQQSLDFTWLINTTLEQKIAINNIIKIKEKQDFSAKKYIPKNNFIFPYFGENKI